MDGKSRVPGQQKQKMARQVYLSSSKWGRKLFDVKKKSKLARQKKAARAIAEIMYASLQKLPLEEQERRMKEIHKIAVRAEARPE